MFITVGEEAGGLREVARHGGDLFGSDAEKPRAGRRQDAARKVLGVRVESLAEECVAGKAVRVPGDAKLAQVQSSLAQRRSALELIGRGEAIKQIRLTQGPAPAGIQCPRIDL